MSHYRLPVCWYRSLLLFFFFCKPLLYADAQPLPVYMSSKYPSVHTDWLVKPVAAKAEMLKSNDGRQIVLYNGLVKRSFLLAPNLVCVDYVNLSTGRQLLRSPREEARLVINNKTYHVGGADGQKEHAYWLPEWIDSLRALPGAFQYESYTLEPIPVLLKSESRFWSMPAKPASGKRISFLFSATAPELKGLDVRVHYDLYDGIPLIVKSLTISNTGAQTYRLNKVVNETLAMVEEESAVEGSIDKMRPPQGIYVETDYAFNNAMLYPMSDQTTHWKPDSAYTSQVHYRLQTPCLLEVYPEKAPGIDLKGGDRFQSVRTHELLMNTDDRETRGLAVRRMYRTVAPWAMANPIFMHVVSRNDDDVRNAIDQCANTGYEALIISFGSHLKVEDASAENIQKAKALADYAHSKHVGIGGYALFSSRSISPADDVIDPASGKPGGAFFGNAPCFGSRWGLQFRDNIEKFYQETGFDIWEMDGPYPGDVCGSTVHPGHRDADDSQWKQMGIQKVMFHWMNEHGVYVNAPDWYFLDGTNKIGIGYREVNFSLPRANQKILNRQNMYDGTWEKTSSMGWGFVPLTEYQGGGAAATLEPLHAHLKDYEQLMIQYYGAGVQACYRGPRLYDTDETKQLVVKIVSWYKRHREILNSDIIHLRRADGRDWDGILHVNPALPEKGLMMLYNPTKAKISRTIRIPLYYTGLSKTAMVAEKNGASKQYVLNRDYTIDVSVTIDAEGYTWLVIR